MISGTSFPAGTLLLAFFESLRCFGPLPAICSLPYEDALSALVTGMFIKDSAGKNATAGSSLYC